MGSVNLWSYRNAGSLSAPLRGSTAAAAWPRIGSASTERPWRSCVSPQSASCSENSAIRPEVSGQTLKPRLGQQHRFRRLFSCGSLAVGGVQLTHVARHALFDLLLAALDLALREVVV